MIELGDKVKDTVTGYEGIAMARTEWFGGCVRILISGAIGKDGKVPDPVIVDEPLVKVVKRAAVQWGRVSAVPTPDHGERGDAAATRR